MIKIILSVLSKTILVYSKKIKHINTLAIDYVKFIQACYGICSAIYLDYPYFTYLLGYI